MEQSKNKETGRQENVSSIRVGITLGDINGIGIETIIKTFSDHQMLIDCTPVIYGSTKTISAHKKQLENESFNYHRVEDASKIQPNKVNVVAVWQEIVEIEFGSSTETGGKYALLSLESAASDLASGKIDVLVTAPISKDTIQQAGFTFPGHTEYLAEMAGIDEALMVMVSDNLRVALVTSHIPLNDVSKAISKEKIVSKLIQFNNSLKKDFGIVRPKIAVLGLNPHAGEKGKLGKEESEVIIPAIQKVTEDGLLAFGPYPADGFFGSNMINSFDGVLSMYHDQGLTGFKALAFDSGVNFTAGLPIVRTSPDHGTAFDIAGKGVASAQSMRNAVFLALDVFRSRVFFRELSSNPLKSQPVKKKETKE